MRKYILLSLILFLFSIQLQAQKNNDLSFEKSAWIDSTWTMDIELGDIDGDGDLDALVANMQLKPFTFLINDGQGNFTKSKQEFPISCHGVALADFDNDRDLDALIIPNIKEPMSLQIWINDGTGFFTQTTQRLGSYSNGLDADILDYDNDGDLDAFVQYYQNPSEYLINDGKGNFTEQERAPLRSRYDPNWINEMINNTGEESFKGYQRVCYLDYDKDGDDDLLIKRQGDGSMLYENSGDAEYTLTDINIPAGKSSRVVIPISGDLNNDDYPDILYLIQNEPNQVWLNNKMGGFTDSGIRLDSTIFAVRAKIGDLDNDGDNDIFIVSGPIRTEEGLVICPNQIWLNSLIKKESKITYISNEGFLLETDNKKVVFDGLFNTIEGNWCDSPGDSIVDLLKYAKPPFDNIDIIAVSHKHVDHFNDEIVSEHLKSNPNVILICPDQVNEILSKNEDYPDFKDRIRSITPPLLNDSIITESGIDIRILRLEHSHYMINDSISGEMINKHRDIENLGYVLSINGRKIFHCGDTNPENTEEYSTFALQKEEIDIAFLERLFYGNQERMAVINNHIKPKHIIIMHLNPANQAPFATHFKQVPNIHVFQNKMESISIH